MPNTKKPKRNLLDVGSYDLAGSTSSRSDEVDIGEDDNDIQGLYKRLAQLYPGTQITSLTRTPEHNAEVGGVANSQHIRGTAGDFVVPKDLKGAFREEVRGRGLESIDEGDHIHVELPAGKDNVRVDGVALPRKLKGKEKYNPLDARSFDLPVPTFVPKDKPVEAKAKDAPVLPAKADAAAPARKGLRPGQTDTDWGQDWDRLAEEVGVKARDLKNIPLTAEISSLHKAWSNADAGGYWEGLQSKAPRWVAIDPASKPKLYAQLVDAVAQRTKNEAETQFELSTYPESNREIERNKAIENSKGFLDTISANISNPVASVKAAVQNVASFLPVIGAGVINPAAGTVGAIAQVGAETFGAGIPSYLAANGVDATDEKAVKAWFAGDQQRFQDALDYTATKTAATTAAVGLMGPVAGKVGGAIIPDSGSVAIRNVMHAANNAIVGDSLFVAAELGSNASLGKETTGKDVAMQLGSSLPFAVKDLVEGPSRIRKADAARDTNMMIRQLLGSEEAQSPVKEKAAAEAKAAEDKKVKDDAFTKGEQEAAEKQAAEDQQKADQQEADHRNAETAREYAGKDRLVKYPDGSMERVPVHPPKELTGEDIANERLDQELQAEAKRIKDEEAESARAERVEVGSQQELLRKEQERAAAKVKEDAEKLEKKQKDSDNAHRVELARKIIAENPGKTHQELQPLFAEALKNNPPPKVTLETSRKGRKKGKTAPTPKPAPVETKPAETTPTTKPVPVRTARQAAVDALKAKQEATATEEPTKDDNDLTSDADVRALAEKNGFKPGEANPDLEMAGGKPEADSDMTPEKHLGIVSTVIKALNKRMSPQTRSLQRTLGAGRIIIVPSAKSVGLSSEGAGIYRTVNGKSYIFADKLDMSNPVRHLLESIPHESTHHGQDNAREGRSRFMEHILSPELHKKVADTIYNGYNKGNAIAKAAVKNAEAAGVIKTKDGVILDPERAKLELVPYFVGEAMKAMEDRSTLGSLGKVVPDILRGSKLALKEKLGLEADLSLKDIEYLARKVVDEAVATPVGEKSRIKEADKARRTAAAEKEAKAFKEANSDPTKPAKAPSRRERLRLKAAEDKAPKAETKPDGEHTDLEMLGSKGGADFDREKAAGRTAKLPDGSEVYWIDDSKSRLNSKLWDSLEEGDTVELRHILHHPELYRNYPALAHITVEKGGEGNGAFWSPQDGFIHIYKDGFGKGAERLSHAYTLSKTLHEITHGVQDWDHQSPGTSPEAMYNTPERKAEREVSTEAMHKSMRGVTANDTFLDTITKKLNLHHKDWMSVRKDVQRFENQQAPDSEKKHISGLDMHSVENIEYIANNLHSTNANKRKIAEVKLRNEIAYGNIDGSQFKSVGDYRAVERRHLAEAQKDYEDALGERSARATQEALFEYDKDGLIKTDADGKPIRNKNKTDVHEVVRKIAPGANVLPATGGEGLSPEKRGELRRRVKESRNEPTVPESDFDLEMKGSNEKGETAVPLTKGQETYFKSERFAEDMSQWRKDEGIPWHSAPRPILHEGELIVKDVDKAAMKQFGKWLEDTQSPYRNRIPAGLLSGKALRPLHEGGDVDLEMLGFGKKKPKVDTPEEDLSPKEVLRRIADASVREQTADIKMAEDLDTKLRAAMSVEGQGKDFNEMNEELVRALNGMKDLAPDQREQALQKVYEKYPKMAPILKQMRRTIDEATNKYVNTLLSSGRKLSPKERKTVETLVTGDGTYLTRAYSAFQRRIGRKWAENRWSDYKKKLTQYLDDPSKLTKEQKDNVESLLLGIDHIREKFVIPESDVLEDMSTSRLEQIYGDHRVGVLENLDYVKGGKDETENRREALLEGLNNRRDTIPAEEYDAMAEQGMKEMLGLDEKSTSVTRALDDIVRDPGTLKQRKNVAPAIRKALGEITVAPGRAIATMETQAALNARAHVLNTILKEHLGEFVIPGSHISKPGMHEKFPKQLKGEQYGPLNGFYATQRVYDTLTTTTDAYHTYGEAMRAMGKNPGILLGKLWKDVPRVVTAPITRLEKIGQVVIKPATWPGNALGSPINMLKNGNFSPVSAAKGIRDSVDFVEGTRKNTTTDRLQDLLRYANIENVSVSEMQNVLGDKISQYLDGKIDADNIQKFLDNKLTVGEAVGRSSRTLLTSYAMMDAWTKIANYHDRLGLLTEYYKLTGSDKSIEQMKREAGHTTSYTNLSSERVPEFLRAMEGKGISKFIPYFSEVARTTWTNHKQGLIDLKRASLTKNKEAAALMRKAGFKRIIGNLMATAALPAYHARGLAVIMAAFGLKDQGFALLSDEENNKKRRRLLSEFNRYQDLLPFGRDAEGNHVYLPTSVRLDPNGPVTELARIAMNAESNEEAYEATKRYLGTLLITPTWASHMVNSLTQSTVPQSKLAINYPKFTDAVTDFISNVDDNAPTNVNKALYSIESLTTFPISGTNPKYNIKYGDDTPVETKAMVGALEKVGMSFEKADLITPLKEYGQASADAKTDNRAKLADALLLPKTLTEEGFKDAMLHYKTAENDRYDEGQKSIDSLRAWGVPESEIPAMLVGGGWGKEEAANLVSGDRSAFLSLASLKQGRLGMNNPEKTAAAVAIINERRAELAELGIKVKRQ